MTIPTAPVLHWEDALADIGDRIRAERRARGWTVAILAQQAGLAVYTVRRLEQGESTLLITFATVCRTLGVDMGQLLSADWELPEPLPRLNATQGPHLSPTQARVLAAVADGRSLSQAARELSMTTSGVASVLTAVYRRLDVAHVPRGERRTAAVRVAVKHRLIDAA